MTTFSFSKRLQQLLEEKDKSQSDLARFLGLKPSAVSLWITGKAYPTFDKLESIARFFRMSLPDLVSDRDPSEATSPHITIINDRSDLQQIPFGAAINVDLGIKPDIGDIVLYKSGDKMRFLRLAAYKDGISVLMSDLDHDPPVIATSEDEIIGTATAILLRDTKKEPASDATNIRTDLSDTENKYASSLNDDYNTTAEDLQ